MTTRVIDASLVGAVLFPGQANPTVADFLAEPGLELRAPHLLAYEVANSAHQLLRRQIIAPQTATEILQRFEELAIVLVSEPSWPKLAFSIAQRFRQRAIYDAIYVACAEDLGAELWTRDRRFVASFGDVRPGMLRLYPDDLPA